MITPPSNPSTNSNEVSPALNNKKSEEKHALDVQVADPHDPACHKQEEITHDIPLSRASIDQSHLPTPNQEIFTYYLDYLIDYSEVDMEYEKPGKREDQGIINESEIFF